MKMTVSEKHSLKTLPVVFKNFSIFFQWRIQGLSGEWQVWIVTPLKGLEKTVRILAVKVIPVESILSKFECLLNYMCLLQRLVTCEGCHVISWAILKIACPMKANIYHSVWALTRIFIFLKGSVTSEDHFFILHNSSPNTRWPLYCPAL